MKRSIFLIIAAVLGLIFGAQLLFNTSSFMAMHGMTVDATSSFAGKILGASFLGLAVTYWAARKSPNSPAMTGILLGGLLANLLESVVAVKAVNAGFMNSLGWTPVIVHGILALGFAYYALIKKDA